MVNLLLTFQKSLQCIATRAQTGAAEAKRNSHFRLSPKVWGRGLVNTTLNYGTGSWSFLPLGDGRLARR